MAHKKVKVEKDTAERWLLTYADLMNLLLILFILLYTMANVDVAKYQQVATSLRAAFGDSAATQVLLEGGASPSMVNLDNTAPSPVVPATLEDQQIENIKETVENLVKNQGLQGEVDVTVQERGIVISIGEQVLFKSGSADIAPESKNTIIQIATEILMKIPGKQIRVEGHTDNVPISSSRFPDNQELSTARANSVLRILRDDVGLDPKKLSSTGYGEYVPKVSNDTDEHRRQNRRVDIAILRDIYDKAGSGADTSTVTTTDTATGTGTDTTTNTITNTTNTNTN
jgi:chemotaxis protein MotB